MSEATPIFSARGVVSGYLPGVDILRGIDLTLSEGELVGVIGPNGAGKSTLVKAMFGLVPVREGSVLLGEEEVTNLPAHELVSRGIGYVPQLDNVFSTLTVEDNLRMGIYLQPVLYEERVASVHELFPLLAERRYQKAGLMSGGERQMLAIGRALMMDPHVLLLDEPSAGLSPANQDLVFDRVREIAARGISLIMVEQNARRCLQICDRGYVLDQGRNAHTGTGEQLLHDPKVIDLYLGTLGRVE